MKTFRTVREQYAILGIDGSSNQSPKIGLINTRVVFGFLLFGCLIASQFIYMFHITSDFMEYMQCISSTSATFIIFICLVAIVLRKNTVFETIDNLEKLITASRIQSLSMIIVRRCKWFDRDFILKTFPLGCKHRKSEAFFRNVNQQVERLSESVFIVSMKILIQIVLLPKCVVSYGVYFFTESQSDSFQLSIPIW